MLIVMAVVALLLTIALPHYFGSLEKSRDLALQENLKVLRVTLDRFFADKGRYPDTLEELVEQKYLRALPVDPITDSPRSWIPIQAKDSDIKGIADIKSGAHGLAKDGRAYDTF